MFSSKQVDYVRYWLHAMKLTKNPIPLPYSDCLLLASDLKTISPVTYLDGGSLRSAVKARSILSDMPNRTSEFRLEHRQKQQEAQKKQR